MRLESQNRAITLEGGGDVIGRGNREKEIEKKLHFLYEEAYWILVLDSEHATREKSD